MDTKTIICPRCEGYIPNNVMPGAYPGALSRADNETEVCSECGMEEAVVALINTDEWPLTQYRGIVPDEVEQRIAHAWARHDQRLEFDALREEMKR